MHNPHNGDSNILRQERQAHEAFAETRRRVYLERAHILSRLDETALQGGSPIVITGESGAGKSALLAYWSHAWRARNHKACVVDHYVGVGSMGSTPAGLLRRLMLEIDSYFHLSRSIPQNPDDIVAAFPEWLALASGREQIVLVIDALNQFPPRTPASADSSLAPGGQPDWLPDHLPGSVSLVVSTGTGQVLDSLVERGWPSIMVEPLSEEERRTAFRKYLGASARDVGTELEKRISTDSLFANPLFLMTSIQELRAAPTRFNESIDRFRTADSIGHLFERVLERFELQYGKDVVRELLSLLWALREGMDIDEAARILPSIADRLPTLIASLTYYLIPQGRRVIFFHEQMRVAVEKRYLSEPESVQGLRLHIAEFYNREPASERRAFEQPWQLLKADRPDLLEQCIIDPHLFPILSNWRNEFDLLGYWHALAPEGGVALRYLERFDRIDMNSIEPPVDQLYMQLGRFLQVYGELEPAVLSFEKALEIRKGRLGSDHPATLASAVSLADLLIELGRYDQAEPLCRTAVNIQERTMGTDDMATVASVHTLGILLFSRGQYAEAESLLRRVLAERERVLQTNDPVIADTCKDLAMTVRERGDYDEAERLLRRAIRICEESYGREHPATATMMTELAPLLAALGRIDESITLHRRALAIRESSLGPDHLETAQSYHNLTQFLEVHGRDEEADLLVRSALRIYYERLGPHHPNTAISLHNLAKILLLREEYHEAETMFRQALDVFDAVIGTEHPTTIICKSSLTATLMELGKFDEAEALIHDALDCSRRSVGERHFNTAVCLARSADLNHREGNHDVAARQAAEALSILDETVGRAHGFSALAIVVLASTALENGERESAGRLHDEAMTSLLSLRKPDLRLARRLADLKARLASEPAPPQSSVR